MRKQIAQTAFALSLGAAVLTAAPATPSLAGNDAWTAAGVGFAAGFLGAAIANNAYGYGYYGGYGYPYYYGSAAPVYGYGYGYAPVRRYGYYSPYGAYAGYGYARNGYYDAYRYNSNQPVDPDPRIGGSFKMKGDEN